MLALIASYIYIAPGLPSVDTLQDFRLQVPLRVYTRDQRLIAEFGSKKRIPVKYADIPDLMVKAFLAAEDDRFFEHPGVDYQGILRAAVNLARTGAKSQGGSTITMQVARNFFLSSEKTYLRKLNEIFLALKIEQELSKEEILELYLNKIYLGNRAYGVGAAAQIYYGLPVSELSLPQLAMLAGLPKAPSRYNPIAGPERALARRNWIIGRMLELGYIDQSLHDEAIAQPDNASLHQLNIETDAPYMAEMVRSELATLYGDKAYTNGYQVYTTIDSRLQQAANRALRDALFAYDTRHGYRGVIRHLELQHLFNDADWLQTLRDIPGHGGLTPALVVAVADHSASVITAAERNVELAWDGLKWARKYIDDNHLGPEPQTAGDILTPGDLVYVRQAGDGNWLLAQEPEVEGAIVSLKPDDGAIVALAGGFDFYRSKFNRATQAERQPGSSFKPFIYSAALNKGFTPASIINDAPVVFDDPALEDAWRPENYSGRFFGPTRMRVALMKSRNLVSIRLLRSIGVRYAIDYISRFGFDPARLPGNLSLALGSPSLTPLELARGYTVIANGGYTVKPHFIDYIKDMQDEITLQATPPVVCRGCPEPSAAIAPLSGLAGPQATAEPSGNEPLPLPDGTAARGADPSGQSPAPLALPEPPPRAPRAVPADNIYLITSMMQDVIRYGTGRRARQLHRNDIAGKTGTTNDQHDAWFAGFNPDYVTIAWVGFDKVRSLGNYETGGRAALPMWIDYMREALAGLPERTLQRPEGMVTVRIDPETGLLASPQTHNSIFETFRQENVPSRYATTPAAATDAPSSEEDTIPEQLF